MEKRDLNNKPQKSSSGKPKFNLNWLYLLIIFALFSGFFMGDRKQTKDVSWSVFESYMYKGYIEKIDVFSPIKTSWTGRIKRLCRLCFGKDDRPYAAKDRLISATITSDDAVLQAVTKVEEKTGKNIDFNVSQTAITWIFSSCFSFR